MSKGKVGLVVLLILSVVLKFSSAAPTSSSLMKSAGSSLLFPVHGNVYPSGYYNVTLYIGQPAKPYFLDIDTGSDLTWLQCDAPCVRCAEAPHPYYKPSNDLVVCKDPICASLYEPGEHKCPDPKQCDYEVQYADSGSSFGVLVRDVFAFKYKTGVRINSRLALGWSFVINHCKNSFKLSKGTSVAFVYRFPAGPSNHPLDGILGLGKGSSSILAQLHSQNLVRNVIGHCLSGQGGGFLFFGDDIYDSSRVVWIPMSPDYTKHYSPGVAELIFGGKTSLIKNLLIIFDSGSSYTYFNHLAYEALTSVMKKELTRKPLKEAPEDQTLPLCWKGQEPFKNTRDVKKYFKPLSLRFANGKTRTLFELNPEAYLIISSNGNVCLGILNGTEIGLGEINLIGDISMQDKMVIYDNEKQMIGWIRADCDRLPRSKLANI